MTTMWVCTGIHSLRTSYLLVGQENKYWKQSKRKEDKLGLISVIPLRTPMSGRGMVDVN